ncbi:MAG: hypothetical protein KME27_06390 [Lyngbya sp. HA4199-MV5]|nr:hypothetical protein [Lyngbya sp. HA4199-MV5]
MKTTVSAANMPTQSILNRIDHATKRTLARHTCSKRQEAEGRRQKKNMMCPEQPLDRYSPPRSE